MYKSGNVKSTEEGEADIKKTLKNGEAVKKFQDMIINQGVDPDKAEALCAKGADMWSILPKSMFTTTIKSPMSGTFTLGFICNNFMKKRNNIIKFTNLVL